MKFILTGIFMGFFLLSFSQTKQETQDWLIYNLNKYGFAFGTNPINNQYKSITFKIVDNKLEYSETVYLRNQKTYKDSLLSKEENYIDFSKIIKINLTIDSNDSAFPLIINFDFTDKIIDFKHKGVKETYLHNGEMIENNVYNTGYSIYFTNQEILKDNLPNRIKKAMEHLAESEGASLIKDVF